LPSLLTLLYETVAQVWNIAERFNMVLSGVAVKRFKF